jgi:hypothetical protein
MTRTRILPLLAATFVLAACSETATEVMDPQFSQGGGNPHWIASQTGCSHASGVVNCWFKAAGLGNGTYVSGRVGVDGTVTVTCTNPAGHSVPGWTGRTRVGSGSATFGPTSRNGQLSGSYPAIQISFQGNPSMCPNGQWSLTHSVSNLSWEMTGSTNTGVNLGTLRGAL